MKIIKNVSIVNPGEKLPGTYHIYVDRQKIVKIQNASEEISEDGEIIDATSLTAMPGFMDVHVHFRDPGLTHKEDIYTGAKASARGGYTDVVMMANTKPSVDNEETLSYVLNKGAETAIHVHAAAAITKGLLGEELTDFDKLFENGAVGFTDDGIPLMDENLLRKACQKAVKLNVPLSLHEEDKTLISENGINKGVASDFYHIEGSPSKAEYTLVARDIEIAKETGAKLNIQHISCKESVELVRNAHEEGYLNIYAEVTPHHFSLTEKAVIEHGANAKMNPPLRTDEDLQAIREGIEDGTIAIIATDHAPHAESEKALEITKAPSGIIGIETAFSLGVKNLVNTGIISLERLVMMLTDAPRELYGFSKLHIEEGAPADFVLADLKREWTYSDSLSKSKNTPFLNETLPAKIMMTFCKGEKVYENL